MFDFTNRVKKIINEFAPQEAKRLKHEYLGPEHILLGLLKAQDSIAVKILQNLNIDLNELKVEIEKRCDQDSVTLLIDPNSNDKIQRVLEYAREEARKLRHSYIGSEHMLLAILREADFISSAALATFAITYQVIRNELNQTIGLAQAAPINFRPDVPTKRKVSKTLILDGFSRDLTKMVKEKTIDPVIGRNDEINRVIQILSRKRKNNPLLIGEAGVGKTAIVEGLAQVILNKHVPETLFEARVFSLDVAALIAGTKYRGEFEDRLKKIMKEVQSNKNIILFIDEIHTIIGAGAAEGAVDAANILKPSLSRGEIQCIGATTLVEYKRYIERDSALERRFQTVVVEEPSIEDTTHILLGLRKTYEDHHDVIYNKNSIKAAVRLSNRFITDRYLPDKAIDIIDEVGARARLGRSVIPDKIRMYERTIEKIVRDKNDKVKLQEYEQAAKFRDEIVKLKKEYNKKLKDWRKNQKRKPVLIDENSVIDIISEWTGVPLQQLKELEAQKLVHMEEKLSTSIIGQKNAIEKITKAVRRSRSGLKSHHRPIGSFIFLGPTGVGKTQLVKSLAKFMFGSVDALIRFDMSEYMEIHSISKFIGSPPGYIGYEEGGQLTEAIRRKPYSILLFDEIEKAHHDVQNVLLQILDEGILTDTMGHCVNFKETIIIMTSNLGARELLKGGKMGFGEKGYEGEGKKDQVLEELKRFFSPEFLNRIDEIIVFETLKQKDMKEITYLLLDEINENIIQRNLHIELSVSAVDYLSKKGFDEKYGARPLRRLLQKEIEDELAMNILEKKITKPALIKINLKDNKLIFKITKLPSSKLLALKRRYVPEEESVDDFWDVPEGDLNSSPSVKKVQKKKKRLEKIGKIISS